MSIIKTYITYSQDKVLQDTFTSFLDVLYKAADYIQADDDESYAYIHGHYIWLEPVDDRFNLAFSYFYSFDLDNKFYINDFNLKLEDLSYFIKCIHDWLSSPNIITARVDFKSISKVEIVAWYRANTGNWVSEITYQVNNVRGAIRYTGDTENEARNAAFAALGAKLLEAAQDKKVAKLVIFNK